MSEPQEKTREETEFTSFGYQVNSLVEAGQLAFAEEIAVEVGDVQNVRRGWKIITKSMSMAASAGVVESFKKNYLANYSTLVLAYAERSLKNVSGQTQVTLLVRSKNLLG